MNKKNIKNIVGKRGVKKGFTLIELLIVISIALILMSFMLPKFNGYMTKAKNLKAENEAQQIYTAVMASYGEEGGVFNEVKIQQTVPNLLGSIEDFDATVNSANLVTINFTLDGKGYVLTIDTDDYKLENKNTTNPS